MSLPRVRAALDTTAPAPAVGRAAWGAASGQIVVGAVPRQLAGFLPRPVLLAQLAEARQRGAVVQVMTGLPGAGKTQLAAAYARARLAADWRLVAWVHAGNAGNLLAGLGAVADAAGLPRGSGRDAAGAGQAVRALLEADGERCLLVLDDVEDPGLVRPFVPAGGGAQVLITTTSQPVADLGTRVNVDVFSEEEALAFLDGRTGQRETGAAPVAAELGFLPLALAQAVAVITGPRMGYRGYLKRLTAMSLKEYLSPEPGQPYPRRAAESVLLSLDAVQVSDQTGVSSRVMAIMAVLSAAGVRRELLHVTGEAGALADGSRPVQAAAVDQALAGLAERSLLEVSLDGQAVVMHRLATRVVREALARHGRLASVCRIAASVLEAHADALAEFPDHPAILDLPEQVGALADNTANLADAAGQELADALLRLRFLALSQLIELGDSARTVAFGEQLTGDLERSLGRDHPGTLDARESLATAYQSAGQSAVAIPMFELVLAARERVLGRRHHDTIRARNNLATAYRESGQAARAVPVLEEALIDCQRVLGVDDRRTKAVRANLSGAYQEASQAEQAADQRRKGSLMDQVGGDLQDDGP
jgi:tetratricopeptide repeat protein/NB-ARC domain-containing protein